LKLEQLLDVVKKLEVGGSRTIYEISDGTFFSIRRPEKVGKNLKNDYEVETNLQIWSKELGKPEFMPNHLRLMIDLELVRRANPQDIWRLLKAFDSVFYGEDPIDIYKKVADIKLPTLLRPLDYDLCLEQLFISEQAIGYRKESAFEPKYLYLHGYIRAVLCGDKEIDKLLWSATRSAPPARFTFKDNKKHKKYEPFCRELWYVECSSARS